MEIKPALADDLEDILALQKLAYRQEAEIWNDYTIPPLMQTMDGMREDFAKQRILKGEVDGRIVGSIRAYAEGGTCYIGRVIVRPDFQNRGLGRQLMAAVEEVFSDCNRFELFTGKKSEKNIHFYTKLGYAVYKEEPLNEKVTLIYLEKPNQEVSR